MTDLDKFIRDTQHFLAAGNHGADAVLYNTVARALLLAVEIADNTAVSDVECSCLVETIDGVKWYDTRAALDTEKDDPEIIGLFQQSLSHLRNRGMLAEDPARPGWVRLKPGESPLP